MDVELVSQNAGLPLNGIGRYTRELYAHLRPLVSVRMTEPVYPPFSGSIDPIHYFPIGIRSHRGGSVVHFTEDFGCAQMLWHPIRPAIATSHDLGFLVWPPESAMHRGLDRMLLRLSYLGLKRMDAVITVSEYSRQSVIQKLGLPANRVFAIHSGNDSRLFKPVPNARARLAETYGLTGSGQTKYILYVGVEFPRKNLNAILEILKSLPRNVRLLKVGKPGGERFRTNTLKKVEELDLRDRVVFLDDVPEEVLPLVYSAADVYVCASFLEGFGHPVLEAMSCGTPVVCSNASALPEITGGAAILVPPDDIQAFTNAVSETLFNLALRESLVVRGLRQAASFSWERTARSVVEIYRFVHENMAEEVEAAI